MTDDGNSTISLLTASRIYATTYYNLMDRALCKQFHGNNYMLYIIGLIYIKCKKYMLCWGNPIDPVFGYRF